MKKITFAPNIAVGLITCMVVMALGSNTYAAKLYKWVDKDGNISYQDQPPPKNAKILKEDTINLDTPVKKNTGNTTPLRVYTVANCNACDNLIARLESMGVPTESRLLDQDEEATRRILEQSDSLMVPTVFLGDQIITNINIDSLSSQLEQAGYILSKDSESTEQSTTPNTSDQ